ncbi:MAG TPA: 2-amino-4-hydroxy-6-hydroxymethyldihydropteridine diphosphokinase [Acidimicrobiaceae bacterium]|nr:2-amino-4-hydroxy-6-hydroxymethyldihydropteridine diphosphokinase [Acidimicrobiaceae bacterium]HCB36687.1 2-amino-4-hydroxy-6-hydroxymethyldihydropteridine diphosphokinase [Acidimicrobiaceae bacterium]
MRAFLGLGSNLGDSERLLADALAGLPDVVAVSGLYRSAPVGGPEQPPYLNLVAELRTTLGPYELLEHCRRAEAKAHRVRLEPDGPRTLDVDVLAYGDLRLDDPELTLPHPRMTQRRFVMEPLLELTAVLVPDSLPPAGLVPSSLPPALLDQDCRRIGPAPWQPAAQAHA